MNFFGITKPSQALRAMAEGLRETRNKTAGRVEEVRMDTFGHATQQTSPPQVICYGCAATWAIQKLCPDYKIGGEISSAGCRDERIAEAGLATIAVIEEFEYAIDQARRGRLGALFKFFEMVPSKVAPDGAWCMGTDTWERQLPVVDEYIKALEAQGL